MNTADPLLVTFLDDNDADCPVCGYGLRGLKMGRCPECGVPIELGIKSTDPRFASWVTGLIAYCTASGFSTILVIWLGVLHATRKNGPPLDEAWPVIVGAVLGPLFVTLMLCFRHRYRKLGRATRWTLNGIGSLTLGTLIVIFLAIVR